MIKLYEENEQNFSTLGLGVLTDAHSCEVRQVLNGEYTITMEYPISGQHYNDIKVNRIIVCKPDKYTNEQAFRIGEIVNTIDGMAKIKGFHISYDMSNYPVVISGEDTTKDIYIDDVLRVIANNLVMSSPFVVNNRCDSVAKDEVNLNGVRTLRSFFYTADNGYSGDHVASIPSLFDCELKVDNYSIDIYPKNGLGENRGVTIRYGKNLTNINKTTNNDTNFTGVFPIYSKVVSERQSSESTKDYQLAYIRPNTTPYTKEWLALTNEEDAPPIRTLVDGAVSIAGAAGVVYIAYKIATEGQYKDKLVTWSISQDRYLDVTGDDRYKPYYPKTSVSYVDSTVNITLVEKDENQNVISNGIIYLEGKDKYDYQRILVLDLTSEFQEDPSKDELRNAALKYIENNNIGDDKIEITASFILLSKTNLYANIIDSETICLGDTIKIIYDSIDVSDYMRVKAIEYDVLKDAYNDIELGDRSASFASQLLRTNDKMSYLKNDTNFVTQPTVAGTVSDANNNASFSDDQIDELKKVTIPCPGIIQGSSGAVDQVVAQLLIADNAYIKDTLEADKVIVRGKIYATDGEFSGIIRVNGSDQSYINNLNVDKLTLNQNETNSTNSNEIITNVVKLAGSNKTVASIVAYNNTYLRDTSLDSTGYYGWKSFVQIPTNPRAELIVTQVEIPVANQTIIYYYDDKSFLTTVDGYNPPEDAEPIIVGIELGSTSTLIPVTVSFSDNISVYRSTQANSIYASVSITASQIINENTTITVGFTVECSDEPGGVTKASFNRIAYCTIPNGSDRSGSVLIRIPNPDNLMYPTRVSSVNISPTEKVFYYSSSTSMPIVLVDNNFGPKEAGQYSLGYDGFEWKDVWSNNAVIQQSDARLKKDISYDISKYLLLFDKLKPATFRLINGESNRVHLGLIAQDVKQAMDELNLSSDDFGMFIKAVNQNDGSYKYALRYGELHAIEIKKIQMLESRVEELEKKIEELKRGS